MAAIGELGLSLATGGLTTLSPCTFPILPLVIGGALQMHRLAPLAMGLGMALSFALIGTLLGLAGSALGIDGDDVRQAGGLLLAGFGLVLLMPALDRRFAGLMMPLAGTARRLGGSLNAGSLPGVAGTRRGTGAGLEPLLRPAAGLGADAGGGRRRRGAWRVAR